MKKKLSIGTWAYIFNQEKPTNDFHEILHKLQHLGYEGVELGGFNPHPGPDTCDTKAKRQALRKEVADHGLEFSGLAADLWSQKLLSVEDSGPYIAAFAKNLFFAEDLGIDTIRVDTVEDVDEVPGDGAPTRRWSSTGRCAAFDLCAKLAANRGHQDLLGVRAGLPVQQAVGDPGAGGCRARRAATRTSACSTTPATPTCAPRSAPTRSATKETLPGGELELLEKLKGKITHVHLIDSDGTLNEHNTSTHNPFGTGKLNFDKLLPALNQAGVPNDWWCVDLCFWPDAWSVTADSKTFLDKMRKKYAA